MVMVGSLFPMAIPSIIDSARLERIEFSNDEIARYSRHLIMPEVTLEGQKRLKAASVLCIGTGGLGSPIALYLAAAGIGRMGLVDGDTVDFSNLQRQILHGTKDVTPADLPNQIAVLQHRKRRRPAWMKRSATL